MPFNLLNITTDFSVITDALATAFNVGEIASIIATIVTSTVGVAILWFGARKLVNAVIGAFKSGKIRF